MFPEFFAIGGIDGEIAIPTPYTELHHPFKMWHVEHFFITLNLKLLTNLYNINIINRTTATWAIITLYIAVCYNYNFH